MMETVSTALFLQSLFLCSNDDVLGLFHTI